MNSESLAKLFWGLFWWFLVLLTVALGLHAMFVNVFQMEHVTFGNSFSMAVTVYMIAILLKDTK